MKLVIKKIILYLILAIMVLPINIIGERVIAEDRVADPANITEDITPENIEEDGPSDDFVDESGIDIPEIPASLKQLDDFYSKNFSNDANNKTVNEGFLFLAENITSNPKLVLNPSDEQDIRILYCMGKVIPDYANNPDSLATELNRDFVDIIHIQNNDPEEYQKLVEQAQNQARTRITDNLKNDVENFACIAGVDQVMAAEMLQYQQEEVDAIIEYAKEKIVIDKRILQLLVNLVTPKDQGGGGHEQIEVYRIRRGYDRETKIYSRESNLIYEQLAKEKETKAIKTIEDMTSATRSDLEVDSSFNNAEALAAVIDSYGRSKGDLIFSDAENEINISAHSKGQAVDISAVDNIKCTLIKKRRLSNSTKVKQPATPIELAWQTSEGYDSSSVPDYSSLNSNIRDIASQQYLDLLNEFDIDADYDTDLSSGNFSDIVAMIGNSLIGEILNSPGSSLSGYSLGDTIRKIGALIFADMFELSREALLDSDLLDLRDLQEKIGEATLEKRLNLPYGSIRGENLYEILVNIGVRRIEAELAIPRGTISPGLNFQNLQLNIGRRLIEVELNIKKDSFQADTTYDKLREIAGDRKIKMIFSNPSMVDEQLGIDFGISAEYKNGQKSPDNYVALIGAKRLQDSIYHYETTGAAGNALGLGKNLQTADPDYYGKNSGKKVVQIMTGETNNDFYKDLGIEYLAQSLSKSGETRVALMQWLQLNSLSSQKNCQIPNKITLTIPKTNSASGERVEVTIPEDQIMANFGLRRGDLSRLFGCYDVKTDAVFKSLGEKALWNAVRESSLAEQARARFLAEHPEISNFLRTVDFYQSRIKTVDEKIGKINSDWERVAENDVNIQQIKTIVTSIYTIVSSMDIDGLAPNNLQVALRHLKQVPNLIDQLFSAITKAENSEDQSLRDRVNTTLIDVYEIVHNIDEIISGEEQPQIKALQVNDINISSKGANSGSGKNGIPRSFLIMMLSGKLSPKDFLASVGSNRVEDALNLPTNSILYFSKYLLEDDHDKKDLKGAFFRSIGQAQVEETFSLPPFFFQGNYPGKTGSLSDIKRNVAKSFAISESEAGARIMKALNLPGSFSSIERDSISNFSGIINASKNIDEKLGLESGTTANFLNGEPLNKETLSGTELNLVAGKLELSEKVIKKFIGVKTGEEDLNTAKEEKFTDISYNNHNSYAKKESASVGNNFSNQCPVRFRFENNFSISHYYEDNSYVYTDADGTHSFSSLDAAREYQEKNEASQIDFVESLAKSLAKNPATGEVDSAKKTTYTAGLEDFLSDKKIPQSLDDDELSNIQNKFDIPTDALETLLNRKELKNQTEKSYSAYLEYIGRKTAERKVVSTLLGSFSITLAGDQIDATDIFDILNGNGKQVIYRIGSRYLERQLNVPANLINQIIEAPNETLRKCSLAEIGGGLLGSVFGVNNISLSGDIYANIGGAKIEETLNLPARSFRGNNLDELINNIGAVNFARAFRLPPNKVLNQDTIAKLVGDSRANAIDKMGIEEQYQAIKQAVEYPQTTAKNSLSEVKGAISDLKKEIKDYALATGNIGQNPENINTVDNYQQSRFQQRMTEIDSILNLDQGTTKNLLMSLMTPDQYREKVSLSVVTDMSADSAISRLLKSLGLGEEYRDYLAGLNILIKISDCKPGNRNCDKAGIYDSLQELFSLNLDKKLGVPQGTVRSFIVDPKSAISTMASNALARLDHSLGLDPTKGASLYAVYQIEFGNNNSNYRDCEPGNPNASSCLVLNQDEGKRWEKHTRWIAEQLTANYFEKIGILKAPEGYPDSADLLRIDTASLVAGDLRVLELTAAIKAVEALHIYGENNETYNLPEAFRISYEDIRYAIFGNPEFEETFVDQARNNFFSEYQWQGTSSNTSVTPITEDTEMDGPVDSIQYGAICPFGVTSPDCTPSDRLNELDNYDYQYSTDERLRNIYEKYGTDYPIDEYNAAIAETYVNSDPDAQESLAQVEEAARNQARNEIRNNLIYRMSDAKLYQSDKNIPPGFTSAMLSGNGIQRSTMIVHYAANYIRNNLGIAPQDLVDLYLFIDGFTKSPSTFDLDRFVNEGKMARLDSWLSENFSDIFGFDLQDGTFTALFYGIKTGNFSSDYQLTGGGTVSCIRTIYTDWAINKVTSIADNTLGLPTGTTFTAYSMYRNISTARINVANAIKTGDTEKITAAKENLIALKSELISYIITVTFSKQIASVENSLGLVPGTGSLLVGIGVSYLLGAAISPWTLGLFVLMNLFGVYKVELKCTADGYYPELEDPPDMAKYDFGGLGEFDGLNNNAKKDGFVKAAQYKARTLAGDALMLSERIGDELAIPSQIMVGRQEDVDYWNYKIDEVICSKIGGCAGTRAGMWKNPQTTFYTHIGF